jgi:hypothetical protein
MVTQYTILSVIIRPEIQEKISIGLLLFDLDQVYFSYSRNKLSAAKSLVSDSSFRILKETLANIERKVFSDNTEYSDKRGFKIFKNKIFDNSFSSAYISYLSRYSNNILTFSNPKEIYLDMSKDTFTSLFKKYIDSIESKDESAGSANKEKPIDFIKSRYGNIIKQHYDFNKRVTSKEVRGLITPVRVDFAGRNEIDVYVQTVDMEASVPTVSNHINAFVHLKSTYLNGGVQVKDFIITREPEKEEFPTQHDIWRQLKSSKILNYLDLSECEKIIEYAETHNVVPLSSVDN